MTELVQIHQCQRCGWTIIASAEDNDIDTHCYICNRKMVRRNTDSIYWKDDVAEYIAEHSLGGLR